MLMSELVAIFRGAKKLQLLIVGLFAMCLLILTSFNRVWAASSFITTWKTDNEGTSNNNQITIPVASSNDYDYFVAWGDGKTDSGVKNTITHSYDKPGTYQVSISGKFPRIYFNNSGDRKKILSVDQWGDLAWSSAEGAFHGASNLVIKATDKPNFTKATNVSYMFKDAKSITGGFANWDVSHLSVFGYMFAGATNFNDDITRWNMSSAFNTEYMFQNASSFNRDISVWDMSNAGNTKGMFYGASSFNKSLNNWNLRTVFNIEEMFRNASSYDKSFGNWNIGGIGYINNVLSGSALSTVEYDNMLNAWSKSQTAKNIKFDGGKSTYCSAAAARDYLVNTLKWQITDGGEDRTFCGAVEVNFEVPPKLLEAQPANTLVGKLIISSSVGGNFTASFACSKPSYDSKYFEIVGSQVYTKVSFDYENAVDENKDNSYELCVKLTNEKGESTQKYILVSINNVDEDPKQSQNNPQTLGTSDEKKGPNGEVLAEATTSPPAGNNKALAVTGVAIGLAGIYFGLSLSGISLLSFTKKRKRRYND